MKRFSLLLGVALGVCSVGMAQDEPLAEQLRRKPTVCAPGVTETMGQIMARQNSSLPDTPRWMFGRPIKINKHGDVWTDPSPIDYMGDGSWPTSNPIYEVPEPRITVGASWLGPDSPNSGFFPPDSFGAVGPTQVFAVTNGRFRVYSKAGVLQYNVSSNTFFNSVRNASNASDPRVIYDTLAQRWIVCMINVTSPNRLMLAVSSGPTIVDSTSFTFYQFTQDAIGTQPSADAGALFDYPCMGVDNNAIYIGGNMFGSGTPSVFVINKASALSGGPLVVKDFRNIGGFTTPYGVNNMDATATQGYFMGLASANQIGFRKISDPGGNPTIGGLITVSVPSTGTPTNYAPQGSTSPIDSLDRRFFTAQIRTDRITGVKSLWASQNNKVTSAGAGSNAGDRIASRWYQFTNMTAATPTLAQSGNMFSSAATARHFSIPAIAMNGQGHAAIASTTYGADLFASVGGSFRLRTDPLGTLEAASILQASSTAYNTGLQSGRYRWGDYSQTVVDPSDDQTFWTFQEYCSANNQWGVRVIQIRPPAPASIASLTPNSITQGATTNIVVAGTSVAGTEFFDPGAGFTNRLAAALSGTGLTVNSVTFTSPTQFTMNVTATGGATLGARNLTVTNPDGQLSVLNGALTVVAGGAPAPTLTALNVTQKVTLSPSFTLTATGTNFTANSVVRWNGADRATTFVSSTQLNATILAGDLTSAAVVPVTVFTPAPGGGTSSTINFNVVRTILGQSVVLQDHVVAGFQPVVVEVRNVGSSTPLQTFNPILSGGAYSFQLDIAPGNYDVAVKGATWLRKVTSPVNFSGAQNITATAVNLINGDVNDSNLVDIADYSLLASAFDSTPSDGNWLVGADLNGDLIVDIADYSILANSFDLVGDN
ncbi:MAG: hypothetical protein JNJ45_07205 [Chthonomonas sp.]|nr:hypothetical protein [Chthonomonas sp.]